MSRMFTSRISKVVCAVASFRKGALGVFSRQARSLHCAVHHFSGKFLAVASAGTRAARWIPWLPAGLLQGSFLRFVITFVFRAKEEKTSDVDIEVWRVYT